MPVQWQNMELHLGGIASYEDHPHIKVGKLATLQNGRFLNPPTISKRYGYEPQSTTGFGAASIGTPRRVIGFKDEFLMANDRELWAYSHESDRWAHRGEISDGLLTRRKVFADQSRNLFDADMAVCTAENCMVVAWGGTITSTTSEPMGAIIDLRTNTIVRSICFSGSNGAHIYAKVICVGTTFVWFSWDSSSGVINYATFDSSTTTWDFGTTLSTVIFSVGAYLANTMYDVCPVVGSSTDLIIAYQDTTGPGDIIAERYTVSGLGTGSAASHTTGEAGSGSIAVCATSGEDAYVAWSTATQVHARVLNPSTLAAVTGILTLDSTATCNRVGVCRLTANSAFAIWERPEAIPALRAYTAYSTVSDAGAVSTNRTRADWAPASKPWVDSGMAHAVLSYNNPFQDPDEDGEVQAATGVLQTRQPTFTIHAFTDSASALIGSVNANVSRWWGTCAAGVAVAPFFEGFLPAVSSMGSSEYEIPLCYSYRVRFAGEDDQPVIIRRGAVSRVALELASTKRHLSAPWGDDLFIAGARPSIYDSHYVNEHAFPTAPEFFTTGVDVYDAAYQLTSDGTNTYSWCLVWEWTDGNGNIVRSAPSQFKNTLIDSATTASGKGAIQTTLRETLLRGAPAMGSFVPSNARIVPYRAVKDTTPGTISPGPYYRDHAIGFATAYGTVITIGGTTSDADLVKNDQLYTTGDILDTATTPPCKACAHHDGRLWLFGAEDPDFGWFSQPFQEGEQPRFNEALRVYFGEPTVCGKTHGSHLVVFSENSTYLVAGEGPPATGGLDIGFAVERIKADVGCIEPRSLVWTPLGLMFQSRRGIELLDLSYQVQWVGRPIKGILDAYQTITSAVYQPSFTDPEVIFTASIGSAPSRRLVYNTNIDQWSEDVCTFECVSADLVHNGSSSYVHTYVETTPQFHQQVFSHTPDSESTGSTFVGCVIVTPWIELNTVQGWQRVKSLLVLFRDQLCGLTVEVAYDYSATYTETHTWTGADIFALARPQVEVHLSRQKCEAVRFKLTETGTNVDGFLPQPGLTIRSLVVRAGFKPHTYRAMAQATQRK